MELQSDNQIFYYWVHILEKQLKVESITSGSKFQKFQATTVVRAMQNRLAMCMAPEKQRWRIPRGQTFSFSLLFSIHADRQHSVGPAWTAFRVDPLFSSSLLETTSQTHPEGHFITLSGTFQFNQVNN